MKDKRVWLNAGSTHYRTENKSMPSTYEVRLSCIHIYSMSIIYDINQIYFTMNREDLILLRDAITKKLEEE